MNDKPEILSSMAEVLKLLICHWSKDSFNSPLTKDKTLRQSKYFKKLSQHDYRVFKSSLN